MQNVLSLPSPAATPSRLSPVEAWRKLLSYLLQRHYGLELNDTPFCDDSVIQEHINAGVTLADAVNFLVEKYDLFVSIARDLAGRNNHPIFGL